ncbi:MAG: hypothetical protein WDN75_20290 [Bacteroidota bacterium]
MEAIDLIKITGIGVGGALALVYIFIQLIKALPGLLDRIPESQRMIITIASFILFFVLIGGVYFMMFQKDGGNQSKTSMISLKSSFSKVSNQQNECSTIQTGDFKIWLSFNLNNPYYLVHQAEFNLRVVLKNLEDGRATFEIWEKEIIKFQTLNVGESFIFEWKGCVLKLTFLGEETEGTGVKFLLKTRHMAKYKLEKI